MKRTFAIEQLLDGLGPIIFESIKIPFGILNRHHKVLWANDAYASLHLMSPQDLIGKVCYQACHGRTAPCEGCPTQAVIQKGKLQIVEQWFEFPGQDKRWGEVHYYPVRGDDGDVAALLVFGFDVTNRKNRIEVLTNYSKYLSGKLAHKKNGHQKIVSIDGDISITVKFSTREIEILRLMTEGYTNMQIAGLLSISGNTVKTHVNNIFNKMGVNDRTQAAVIATRQKIV